MPGAQDGVVNPLIARQCFSLQNEASQKEDEVSPHGQSLAGQSALLAAGHL